MERKLEKLPGKSKNSGKTESAFLMEILYELVTKRIDLRYSFLFCSLWSSKSFRGKQNLGQLQRKVRKFGQTAKVMIFVSTLDYN